MPNGVPTEKGHIKYRDICSCFQITLEKWVTYHTNADAFYYSQVTIKCSFFCGQWWKCESSLGGGKCFRLRRPQLTITEPHHKPRAGLPFCVVVVYSARGLQTTSHQGQPRGKVSSLAPGLRCLVSDCACYLWPGAEYVDVNLLLLYSHVWGKIMNGS